MSDQKKHQGTSTSRAEPDTMELEGLTHEQVTTGWLGERGEARNARLPIGAPGYWWRPKKRTNMSAGESYDWRGPAPDPTEQHDDLPGVVAEFMCEKHGGEIWVKNGGGRWHPYKSCAWSFNETTYSWRPSPQEEEGDCLKCNARLLALQELRLENEDLVDANTTLRAKLRYEQKRVAELKEEIVDADTLNGELIAERESCQRRIADLEAAQEVRAGALRGLRAKQSASQEARREREKALEGRIAELKRELDASIDVVRFAEGQRDELAGRFPDPTKAYEKLQYWQLVYLLYGTTEQARLAEWQDGGPGDGADPEWYDLGDGTPAPDAGPYRYRPHEPTLKRVEGLTLAEVFEAKPDGETCWAEHDAVPGRARAVEGNLLVVDNEDGETYSPVHASRAVLTGWTIVKRGEA